MDRLPDLVRNARAELPRAALLRWASIFFTLSVWTLLISLTASQAFLAAAGITYAIHLLRHQPRLDFPPIKLPLALFCFFTFLSLFWAANPAVGWFAVRKLVLFGILLLGVNVVTSAAHLEFLFQGLFLEAVLAGLVAAGQFAAQYSAVRALHPERIYFYMTLVRASGFMGDWMNYGGQQMLVFPALLAFLLAGKAKKIWWIAFSIVAVSIVLTFTRGVWVGCFIAAVYLLARFRPRWLWALPVLMLIGYLAAPNLVRERIESVRHPLSDPSLAERFEMWGVGWRMIRKHPWVGVGPNNIEEAYPLYMAPGRPPLVGYHGHLHDNFIQFAAERGLPCLAAWVWMMAALGWTCWNLRIRKGRGLSLRWVADAALAAWLALLLEGCFEYNFGTSPVLMVFLFVISAPYAAARVERLVDHSNSGIK